MVQRMGSPALVAQIVKLKGFECTVDMNVEMPNVPLRPAVILLVIPL